jgi:hypothetical protein
MYINKLDIAMIEKIQSIELELITAIFIQVFLFLLKQYTLK